jgi:hypothetical protein
MQTRTQKCILSLSLLWHFALRAGSAFRTCLSQADASAPRGAVVATADTSAACRIECMLGGVDASPSNPIAQHVHTTPVSCNQPFVDGPHIMCAFHPVTLACSNNSSPSCHRHAFLAHDPSSCITALIFLWWWLCGCGEGSHALGVTGGCCGCRVTRVSLWRVRTLCCMCKYGRSTEPDDSPIASPLPRALCSSF